ncbi:phosphatidate cytidylyltransferase photoreceptor-specific [Anaeramoeba flamelloides]|uniref:Phosphatidate cytidylyltransferase n=1 Tax=Anaeramoeba flamelloides TaxID=1746091 RepID=A0AAV8AG90_9EUKA|nr:phosphatidate cytidylyltransferase photoreceptor-specific [Anaeramoeba flamelloides]
MSNKQNLRKRKSQKADNKKKKKTQRDSEQKKEQSTMNEMKKGSNKKADVVIEKEEAKEKTFLQKFLTRTASTISLIAILVFVFYMGHLWVSVGLVIITILTFREVILLALETQREKKLGWVNRVLPYLFLFSLIYYLYGKILMNRYSNWLMRFSFLSIFLQYHTLISYTLYIVCFILFVASLEKGHYRYQFKKLSWCIMALVLVVWQSNLLIANLFEGLIWVLLPVTLIFLNDIFAYLWGISFGKTPLIKVSPKKTWEGFVGAFFTTILVSFFISKFLSKYDYMVCPLENLQTPVTTCVRHEVFIPKEFDVPPYVIDIGSKFKLNISETIELLPVQLHSIILAIFASLIAPFGGFFASGLKRAIGIKDFANTIPGHGGLADRFDCEFVMGCFSYVYLNTFIITNTDKIAAIMSKIALLDDVQLKLLYDNLTEIVQDRFGL